MSNPRFRKLRLVDVRELLDIFLHHLHDAQTTELAEIEETLNARHD